MLLIWILTNCVGDDNFYGGVSGSPVYDSVHTHQPDEVLTAEEQAAREQIWRAELAKVRVIFVMVLIFLDHICQNVSCTKFFHQNICCSAAYIVEQLICHFCHRKKQQFIHAGIDPVHHETMSNTTNKHLEHIG